MLAVAGKTEPTVEAIAMSFIAEVAEGKNNRMEQAEKFNLLDFFWKGLERQHSYLSDAPSIEDFVKALFQTQSSTFLPREKARLNREAIVFVKRWKDSARFQQLFEHFSRQLAGEWQVEKWLETMNADPLADQDLFELIGQKILSELKKGVLSETTSLQEARALIEQWKQKYWYPK